LLIINEVQNLDQNGPEQNVPFTNSSNPDCCGNGYSQVLGIFPINDILLDFRVEIYEKDGGCCDGYVAGNDDLFATDFITINIIDEVTGTIDVGSCISFNYVLDITPIYMYGRNEIQETVCPDYSITLNNIDYDINNPIGFDTVWGGSANGCDSFIQVELDFYEFIEPEIVGDEKICFDGLGILGLDEEFVTYEWSTGSTDPELIVDEPGFYSVEVTNDEGCLGTAFFEVGYHDSFFPFISGEVEFCEGGQAQLFIDDEFTQYSWSTGSSDPVIVVDESGFYSVTVVNEEGCVSENFVEVTEIIMDVPDIEGDLVFCFQDSTTLTAYNEFGIYEWSTGDSTSSINVTEPGEYSVTISSAVGCSNENSITVIERIEYQEFDTLYTCDPELVGDLDISILSPEGCEGRLFETTELYAPIPSYSMNEFPFIVNGTSVELFADVNPNNGANIDWYQVDSLRTLICENCPSVVVSPEVTTLYEVEIYYHPECFIRDSIEVRVKSRTSVFVPNVFTPDSEDGNNLFTIFGPDIETIDQMNIYDRWGSLVFEGGGNKISWDGTMGGLELLNGVYVYHIELTFKDGTSKTLVGDITLLQ